MKTKTPLLMMCFLACSISFAGEEPDPIKTKLVQAKDAHQVTFAKAKKDVLDLLQQKEDAARADGNKKVVDTIKAERAAFESSGKLPKSVSVSQYLRSREQANTQLEAAYKTAIKEYVRAKRDDDADAAEQELKAFLKNEPAPPPVVPKVDLPKAKPGINSLQFAGRGYVELQKTRDLIDLNGSFTVEMWVRWPSDHQSGLTIMGDEAWPNDTALKVSKSCGWTLRTSRAVGDKREIAFVVGAETPEWIDAASPQVEAPGGKWHHLAVSKTKDAAKLFLNGALIGERDCKKLKLTVCPTDLYLGVRKDAYHNREFVGEFRAFRISNRGRYLKAFKPEEKFAKDASTEVLLDFSGNDPEQIMDLSGKGRHGLLKDVKWAENVKAKE